MHKRGISEGRLNCPTRHLLHLLHTSGNNGVACDVLCDTVQHQPQKLQSRMDSRARLIAHKQAAHLLLDATL